MRSLVVEPATVITQLGLEQMKKRFSDRPSQPSRTSLSVPQPDTPLPHHMSADRVWRSCVRANPSIRYLSISAVNECLQRGHLTWRDDTPARPKRASDRLCPPRTSRRSKRRRINRQRPGDMGTLLPFAQRLSSDLVATSRAFEFDGHVFAEDGVKNSLVMRIATE